MPQTCVLAAETAFSPAEGDRVLLSTVTAPEYAACLTAERSRFPRLTAGTVLTPAQGTLALQVLAARLRPGLSVLATVDTQGAQTEAAR